MMSKEHYDDTINSSTMRCWTYLKFLFGSSAGLGTERNPEISPSRHGYPTAGHQDFSVNEVMTRVFFMGDKRWEECRKRCNFDYVVIGSSFCAWAFTDRMLKKNSNAKILILERGEYFYPEHIQKLPPSTTKDLAQYSKTFHWKTTERMHHGQYIRWQNGMNNMFGGKSAFWRGWCPKPIREELQGWPESVKDTIEEYFPEAQKLLNVTFANEIDASEEKCCVFGELQNVLEERIKSCKPAAIQRVEPASLALKLDLCRSGRVQKLSVAEPLLNLLKVRNKKSNEEYNPLEIKLDCLVEKIVHKNGKAITLKTNKGDFELGNAKLILAMGVFPPTTLMLNSFPSSQHLAGIGTRCSAHFRSSLIARAPLHNVVDSNVYDSLLKKISKRPEVAAFYIPGTNPDSKRQFHIQLSAVLDATPLDDFENTVRHYPDVIPVPTKKQMSSSKEPPYVVFLCKNIGELDPTNEDNWFRLNSKVNNDVNSRKNSNVTYNTTLQIVTNDEDLKVWDTLDESTFAILEGLESHGDPNNPPELQYWHKYEKIWKKERPPRDQIRLPDLVHEASTMWIGDDESSPVDLDYRFRGVENVYLTGPALSPTTGSWNPTCTVAALAINLADKLNENHYKT